LFDEYRILLHRFVVAGGLGALTRWVVLPAVSITNVYVVQQFLLEPAPQIACNVLKNDCKIIVDLPRFASERMFATVKFDNRSDDEVTWWSAQ
jgi:hypothetical protein